MQQQNSAKQNEINIKCPSDNKAFLLCTNSSCKSQSMFTCNMRNCQCQKGHKLCLKGNLESVLQTIMQKNKKTQHLKNYISQTIDKTIDMLSQFIDKLFVQFNKNLKYMALHQFEKKFMRIVEKENNLYSDQILKRKNNKNNQNIKNQTFSAQQSSKLWQLLKIQSQHQNYLFKSIESQLTKFTNNISTNLDQFQTSLSEQIATYKLKIQSQLQSRQVFITKQIIAKSSICNTQELSLRMIKFFTNKQIDQIKLLYKASQHSFSLEKYYELCGTATDTIILCLSNKDKIVGFYTPFYFYSGKFQVVKDTKKQSFMFSLTNNDKIEIIQNRSAITRLQNKSQAILIGSTQILIKDKANIDKECKLCCGFDYQHPGYEYNKESYIKLNGNQTQNCTFKQWEVFKVKFL